MAAADESAETRLARVEWRLDALDTHRERVDKRLRDCETGIGNLIKTDEIAKEVAARVNTTKGLQLTFWQKAGGMVAGALLVADSLRGLLS